MMRTRTMSIEGISFDGENYIGHNVSSLEFEGGPTVEFSSEGVQNLLECLIFYDAATDPYEGMTLEQIDREQRGEGQ